MHKYFQPSKLERWRGGSVFEILGVRFFKRHLLPTELLIRRLRGRNRAMHSGLDAMKAELKRLEWETRRNEVIHLAALVLIGGLLAVSLLQSTPRHLSVEQLTAVLAINLYANVYPILVQRYNRVRILRLGDIVEKRFVHAS